MCVLSRFSHFQLFVDPMDCSPPSSSVHGIFQARLLKWFLCPPPGALPNPGIKPVSLMSPALAGRFFTTSATREAHIHVYVYVYTNTHFFFSEYPVGWDSMKPSGIWNAQSSRSWRSCCCYTRYKSTDSPGLRSPETHSNQNFVEMVLVLPRSGDLCNKLPFLGVTQQQSDSCWKSLA